MAHNKLYRNFIILQEDERGYSHSNDKALSGYAKIEAKGDKCKVSFYAQNLKPEDNCSMVLICCKRELKQLIDIGPLSINEVGKADTSKEYYVNNIAGLGISYEKISGAAICRAKDNENEFIMHGFMNGEDSSENWRKFKLIKADSRSYINKLDLESKKKEAFSQSTENKIVKTNDFEANNSKPQSEVTKIKKDESNLHVKGNIDLGNLTENNFKIEDTQNRIPEESPNITENIEPLDEDRNKDKDATKYHKCNKCDKHDHYDEDKEEVEEIINKLVKKLDVDDSVIDIKVDHHMHEEVIIYGFIKEKKKHGCKWKKFKLEKKCKDEDKNFNCMTYQGSSKRMEENFEFDKLNIIDNNGRSDLIDFDKYEKGIKPSNSNEMDLLVTKKYNPIKIQPTTMNEVSTPTEVSEETKTTMPIMNETNLPVETTSGTTEMEQPVKISMGTLESGNEIPVKITKPEETGEMNECPKFDLIGSIGKYFEKLAEGFKIHTGNLNDINYCKWYKINVNSIDDLSDESNYNKYTLAFYPMLNYYPYISKFRHFLLGYKCNPGGEIKYIVYAIPGSKEKNDQPYGGRTGFVTWTSDNSTGLGYWLMFYDFKNSSIVIPTK